MFRPQGSQRPPHGVSKVPLDLIVAIILWLGLMLAVKLEAQAFTVLHEFTGGRDGLSPTSVALDGLGNVYGENDGGVGGIVFKLQPSGADWLLNPLLTIVDGSPQTAPNQLTFTADNTLYASDFFGGNVGGPCELNVGCGTVFKLRPRASVCLSVIC
jgi:hypothetical protein